MIHTEEQAKAADEALTAQDIKLIRAMVDISGGMMEGRIVEGFGRDIVTHMTKNLSWTEGVERAQIKRLERAGLIELAPENAPAGQRDRYIYSPTGRARTEFCADDEIPEEAREALRQIASTMLVMESVRVLKFSNRPDCYIFEPGNAIPVRILKAEHILYLSRTAYLAPTDVMSDERVMGAVSAHILTDKARAALLEERFPRGAWDWRPTRSLVVLDNLGLEDLLPEDLEIFWLFESRGKGECIHFQTGSSNTIAPQLILRQPTEFTISAEQVRRLRDSAYIFAPRGQQGEKGLYWFDYILTDKARKALAAVIKSHPPLELRLDKLVAEKWLSQKGA